MLVLADRKREWDFVRETGVINKLIFEKLKAKSLFLKHSDPPAEFYVTGENEQGIEFSFAPDLEFSDKITLYLTVKRQIEFDFEVLEITEPGTGIFKPLVARIGKAVRATPRITVGDDRVVITNFQVSKNEISPNNTKLQITNKVIFTDYEKRHASQFPGVKIRSAADKDIPAAVKAYGNQPAGVVQDAKDLFFVVPIIYEGLDQPVVLAYIYFPVSGPGEVDEEKKARLLQESEQIIDRIIAANTITIKEKQKVLDISEGGVAVLVDNEELIKYLPQQKWLTFDVIFKMQAPIRLKGEIRHMEQYPDGVRTGISFAGLGHSDFRKGNEKRLKALIGQLTGA